MVIFSNSNKLVKAIGLALLFASFSSLATPNITFELDRKFTQKQKKDVEQWLQQGIAAVEQSIAQLPQRHLKFSVLQHSSSHPVPWGQVVRGNPDMVKLHVGRNANLSAMVNDWTLYHEISHLYLPYLDYSSFWLSEGFATYMQYIVMYQAGLITKAKFIERMQAGFERGMKNAKRKPGKLKDVSNNMWQMRAYRRVYWSGAAFFLEADIALRAAKGISLTEVIQAYVDCCRRDNSSGISLMKTLDKLNKTDIFIPLYQQYAQRRDFPTITKQQLEHLANLYQGK